MKLEEYIKKYNRAMSQKEISEITDSKIKDIKIKYWNKKHRDFMNEQGIKDSDLENEYNKLTEMERKELEEYYNEYEINHTNPKHAIVDQEVEMMEDMTEGQLAEYLAENFNDY